MTGTVRWRELLAETAGSVGDRQHAWWLCEVASGLDGDELTDVLDDPATELMVAHLDAMVARRRAGEPLQYVLGRWGFRRLDLAVDRRVLIPRPETELLVDAVHDLLRPQVERRDLVTVADLGTGSGAIGLAIADELPVDHSTVWITDVDRDALDVARANLAGLGRPAANVRVAQGSWFEAFDDPELRFDVVVSNPPYVADGSPELEAAVEAHEPRHAVFGGPDGLDHLRVIIADAPHWLRDGGWLVAEIGANQGPAVTTLLAQRGFEDVEVRADFAGRDRIALGRSPI